MVVLEDPNLPILNHLAAEYTPKHEQNWKRKIQPKDEIKAKKYKYINKYWSSIKKEILKYVLEISLHSKKGGYNEKWQKSHFLNKKFKWFTSICLFAYWTTSALRLYDTRVPFSYKKDKIHYNETFFLEVSKIAPPRFHSDLVVNTKLFFENFGS